MLPGTILVLNGASSSGKTSIIRALQKIVDYPLLDAGVDRFLWMLPERYLNRPLWDDVLGPATGAGEVGERLIRGMHHAIAALSREGNSVAADHVIVQLHWLHECAAIFKDLPAYLVGVHCPPELLEQRERARTDRTPGQALAQYHRVHSHGIYDLEVDTGRDSASECAQQIKDRMQLPIPPIAFRRISDG